jgi:Resolvase, N terminal domain
MSIMQPGDHMIVDKIDRLTRRIRDLYSVTDWLEKHQISLHVCTFLGTDMDFSTPVGALIFGVFGLLADFESKQISERQNTHNSACRAKGLCISKYPAPGTEYYWKKGHDGKKRRYAKWSATDRAIMAELVILREQAHLSWEEISDTIEIHLAQQNGRQFKKSAFYQRRWPKDKCRRAYVVEKYYQDHNIRDVTEIPASLGILADKHAKANHYK